MQIQIFTIPVISSNEQIEALNKFLRSHTIIDVDKQLVSSGQNSYWTFCVRYLAGNNYPATANQAEKVDYKEILAPDVFSRFSLLRDCRKEIAEKNGVPVYVVFTNQELSAIAGLPDISVEEVLKINGIGARKIEKYGADLIDVFKQKFNETTN